MSSLYFLILLLSLALVLFGLALGVRGVMRFAKWRGERCQWCGYDLGNRHELRCPECGLEKGVRGRRARVRLGQRLVINAVLPIVLGGFVVGALAPIAFGAWFWSVMPDGVVIRSSFGASASDLAREELERRMRPLTAGGTASHRRVRGPLDPGAFTPEQWDRIATAILDDIARVDAQPQPLRPDGIVAHADWLLSIPADADLIRVRVAELLERGAPVARKNAVWLIEYGDFQFPPRWVMDERLCPMLVETMLTDPHRLGHQVASDLFTQLCRCHWESNERFLREATDELIAIPNHHPTRFISFTRVQTPEEAQGLFLFVERMRSDGDPNIQRFRDFLDSNYRMLRDGQFGRVVSVNGVMRDERWTFVPKTRAELEAEGLGGEAGGGDGVDGGVDG